VTDVISDLLLVSEPSGVANLRTEGVAEAKIRLVGNVMIDTLMFELERARARRAASSLGLSPGGYGFVTLHRPANVDDPATLGALVDLLHELSARLPLVFAVHPRTLASAKRAGIADRLVEGQSRLVCLGPVPYHDALSLVADARLVMTDSGGLQEETSALRVPCLTLRENTERPVTVERGTSRLVGSDPRRVRSAFEDVMAGRWAKGEEIPLWDGRAGERVAGEIAGWLAG
jgi:UDP-N-acetylglucosamine 2-epimerase (non-hydrolysing)